MNCKGDQLIRKFYKNYSKNDKIIKFYVLLIIKLSKKLLQKLTNTSGKKPRNLKCLKNVKHSKYLIHLVSMHRKMLFKSLIGLKLQNVYLKKAIT